MSLPDFDNDDQLPGFGLQPSEEVLVNFYLKQKILGNDDQVDIFTTLDVRSYEPWELPGKSVLKSENPPWYFFSPLKRKYRNSARAERTTKAGYWKVTGKDRPVKDEDTGEVIAIKKTLVFYKGRVPNGERTNWTMQEFHAAFKLPKDQANDVVLCKLKRKHGSSASNEVGESSRTGPNNQNNNNVVQLEGQCGALMSSEYDNSVPEDELQAYMESYRDCVERDWNQESSSGSNYSFGNYGYGWS